ncbi:MAG: GTPase domain-containing protein [Candidatus Lokiarchaeota archaeon]|nr:GTPase domain-containing protein [Candidatus Lokiarchaeota archaeon]
MKISAFLNFFLEILKILSDKIIIIDALEKTIQLKIVYYGPALSGKTTSIKQLFNHFGKQDELCSIESTVRRTLFFDYGIISFQNEDWLLKLNIYSCTGQDFYIVTRPITLKGVDGIIFVADSQTSALDRDLVSWNELKTYFKENFEKFPLVIAFNKQDLPRKFSSEIFLKRIDYKTYKNKDIKYTIAVNGENILSSFEDILRLIFINMKVKSELFPAIQTK